MLRLDCAEVTVAMAIPPFGTTTMFPTLTSSKTSRATESPTCASAAVVNPQEVGKVLPTWETIRQNEMTSITFDKKTRTLIYKSATIPATSQLQQALSETRRDYGEVKFVRLQFRRGELDDRNSVLRLVRTGFKQIDGLPGVAQFERDLSKRPARPRVVDIKPEPKVEPKEELIARMTPDEYARKADELIELRARIQKHRNQCASEEIS
jgi:hypothetical protein